MGNPQAEVINRICKECFEEGLRVDCFERLVFTARGEILKGHRLHDNFLKTLISMLNLKLVLQPAVPRQAQIALTVVDCMHQCVTMANPDDATFHCKSLSFSKFVFTFITKYKKMAGMAQCKSTLELVVPKLKTFIEKPAAKALAQLE